MPQIGVSMRIDEVRAARKIEQYIQSLVEKHSADGVLLGLSGGLDSAVLASLAVRSLGNERVHVFYLYERHSEPDLEEKARRLAGGLGIELEVRDIEPVMRERGVYDSSVMRGSILSRFLNRILIRSYRWVFGEPPFVSTLRRGEFGKAALKKTVYDASIRHIEAAFNARHQYRREFLEKQARAHNCVLLGAANRSECMVGWFVKDGVDDLPLSPLMGLYKTQVRQLAAYLGIPSAVIDQVPSPDMLKGVTDEFAIGMSYATLDLILDGIDRGIPDDEIVAAGLTRKQISRVREIHRLSEWKRQSPHEDPPVDGGARGGMRLS